MFDSPNSWCSHQIATLLLVHHIILMTPIPAPTPRSNKCYQEILNISAWHQQQSKKDVETTISYLNHIFLNKEWDDSGQFVATLKDFRIKKLIGNDDTKNVTNIDNEIMDKNVMNEDNSTVFKPIVCESDISDEDDYISKDNLVEFRFKFIE